METEVRRVLEECCLRKEGQVAFFQGNEQQAGEGDRVEVVLS